MVLPVLAYFFLRGEKILAVRSLPIHSSPLQCLSIWYTKVRKWCPFSHCTSSTPMDSMPSRLRWAKPQATTIFTERNTFSQLVRKTRATCFHANSLAHRARKHC
jgi:hypothetical protein